MAQIYENFTLTVPSAGFLATGRAQLAVARLHLIGVSYLNYHDLTNN
jgi:hypothetical protein